MSRNSESHFSLNPIRLDMPRSRFDRPHSLKTSFNVGDIIPIFYDQVLPGDTFDLNTSMVVRLQSLKTPLMDNMYLDTYYFFVPNRLVWEHWKEFMGENTESAWIPQTEYEIPQIEAPSGGWNVGTLADYFGVPTGIDDLSIDALPFRAYAMICNEWFRDENLSDPLNIPVNDSTITGVNTGTFVTDVVKGGLPYKAAKYHDYFTSCLPGAQKGAAVQIPVAQVGNLPVMPLNELAFTPTDDSYGMSVATYYGQTGSENFKSCQPLYHENRSTDLSFYVTAGADPFFQLKKDPNISSRGVAPVNLWAINNASAAAATINDLRLAFQVQKLLEKNAIAGSRYTEILKAHFGVTSPDSRLQRPEYLGGKRIPLNINQVVQTSASDASSPQGNVAGYSVTADRHNDFTHSFTEHGMIIGLAVVRYDHTYQQGLERCWSRKTKYDFFWPVFNNIGNQAVLNKEIYCQGDSVVDSDGNIIDNQVFGYQEAWADYRYKPNHVTGEMRSSYATSLDFWHLGDEYSQLPVLSDSWIREDTAPVDRVLAVTSSVSNQLFGDFYFDLKCTRCMTMYSVPGLIDHH